MSKGYFISLEGGEGAGKTTQINQLAEFLTGEGYKVITTREPGGTPEAEKIRNLLVQREGGNWTPMAECLLLFAARVMHVEKVIKPAIEAGKVVITDRFTDSTRAYQGYGHGMELDQIEAVNTSVLADFAPDLTLVLDVDPDIGLSRSGRRLAAESLKVNQTEDRYENLDLDFHKRLRNGYLEIAKNNPDRCHVIDAMDDIAAIQRRVQKITMENMKDGPVRRGTAA